MLHTRAKSNVKAKLDHFVETGQILRRTPTEQLRRGQAKKQRAQVLGARTAYLPQKALLMLKSKYDTLGLQTTTGKLIDVHKLSPKDLNTASPRSLDIFKSVLTIKSITKKPVDSKILLLLLGLSPEQLRDPFMVTENALRLLERDQDAVRATHLARIAGKNGTVAMNSVLQWLLDHGDVKGAMRNHNDRKKWGVPFNSHSHVILLAGIARSHEWGSVSDDTARKCVGIFEGLESSIETFNACLSVLVKNFNDDQAMAWDFFDRLVEDKRLIANGQTFTIFLNGIKRFHGHKAQKLLDSRTITAKEKAQQLLDNQTQLIHTAESILAKVLEAAKPPPPPTKEEADKDPQLLVTYREKARRLLVDVDAVFANAFVSCYLDAGAGTAATVSQGAHYAFIKRGLQYLVAWSPEVKAMLEFVGADLEPTKDVKRLTDARMGEVKQEDIDPAVVNPMVVFPPPALSKNKKRAIFSNKHKPLVDFSRPKWSEVRLFLQNKQYKDSKGKYGRKAAVTLDKRSGVNRFLVMSALNGLVNLGHTNQFYLGVWYVLSNWGGMYVNLEELVGAVKSHGLAVSVLELDTESRSHKILSVPPHNPEVVDIMLIENFLYKMHELFDPKLPPSRHIVELMSMLMDEQSNLSGVKPRDKTINIGFSVLTKELHHFNDSNYNKGVVLKKKQNIPNNTPKKSITGAQLASILPSIVRFMDTVLKYDHFTYTGKRKAPMANFYVDSFNKLVQRLYDTTWTDVTPEQTAAFHKLIVKSGIRIFKPQPLVDPRDKISYAAILPSIKLVYKNLSERNDLGEADRKVMLNLRDILTLKSDTPSGAERYDACAKKVYENIDANEFAK